MGTDNGPLQDFLCWLGIHDMPKWGDKVMVYLFEPLGYYIQERICRNCGAIKRRRIR